jgi:hypothetical protein
MKRIYPMGLRIQYFAHDPFDYVIATSAPSLRGYVVIRSVIDLQPIGAVDGIPDLIEIWHHGDDLCSLKTTPTTLRGTRIEPLTFIRLRFDFTIKLVAGMRLSVGLVCEASGTN